MGLKMFIGLSKIDRVSQDFRTSIKVLFDGMDGMGWDGNQKCTLIYRRQLPERVDPTPQNFNSLTLTTTTTTQPQKNTGFKGVFQLEIWRFKGVLQNLS